jgi:hypothetical protein
LWSEEERVSQPILRPDDANWSVPAGREIPIGFDAGEIVAHRLWLLAGQPSKTDSVTPHHIAGHFDAKVRIELVYDGLGVEKSYAQIGTVQVDPINSVITRA